MFLRVAPRIGGLTRERGERRSCGPPASGPGWQPVGAHRLRHTAATEMLPRRRVAARGRPGAAPPQRWRPRPSTPRSTSTALRDAGPAVAGRCAMSDLAPRAMRDYLADPPALGFKLAAPGASCSRVRRLPQSRRRRARHHRAGAGLGHAARPGAAGVVGDRLGDGARLRPLPQAPRPGHRGPPAGSAARAAAAGSTPYIYSDADIAALLAAAGQLRHRAARRHLPDPDRAAGRHRHAGRRGARPRPRRRRPRRRGCSPSGDGKFGKSRRSRCTRAPSRRCAGYARVARPAAAARRTRRRASSSPRTGTRLLRDNVSTVFAGLVDDAGLDCAPATAPAPASRPAAQLRRDAP